MLTVVLLVFVTGVITCNSQATGIGVSVYFKRNSSALNRKSAEQLAKWLSVNKPPIQLSVKGFTDTTGNSAYNRTLSMARANAVAGFIKRFSNDYSFAVIQGVGEDSLTDRLLLWQNRRVFVEIKPNSEPSVPVKITEADSGNSQIDKRTKRAGKRMNVALENIFFVPDKPVLEEVSLYYLQDLVNALQQYPPNASFEIVGHVHCVDKRCNDPGLKKINEDLSTARAKEVYMHLVERGIAANRLTYRGVGSQNLSYPQPKNEEEARKNMRVEIIVQE